LSGEIATQQQAAPPDRHTVAQIQRTLGFVYPYGAATQTPSKQTATQRKGRVKDQEVVENAPEPKVLQRPWRKASFIENQQRGVAYGSAMHVLLQYIQYDRCDSIAGVRREVARLVDRRILTAEQAELINCRSIAALFETPLGRKLMHDPGVLREFKFSILDDAEDYTPGIQGEKVLLQGVVDCAIVEEDGITVIDFKTDYVTEDSISNLAERYSPQVQTYASALQRIFGKKIKGSFLYFFHLGCFIEV
jgi:ATP-dependent helicase/nuclease subunit A